ncbi:MAG: hypothetical protein DRP51_01650 [Candidatus Zixiibacteriota bacterium]|nr:MAG: hypothetical protein DRP51_01650 [candidate division Zixibacteria bacterium]
MCRTLEPIDIVRVTKQTSLFLIYIALILFGLIARCPKIDYIIIPTNRFFLLMKHKDGIFVRMVIKVYRKK